MNRLMTIAAAIAGFTALQACVAPVGPVEVTRFHVPDAAPAAQGTFAVEPAQGHEAQSLEFRTYAAAISREMNRIGYSEMVAGGSASQFVAILAVDRHSFQPGRDRGPVSVGVGGSTGSYGSGVGVGIGLDLSGPPPEQIETRMAVMIRERETGTTVWEGRASFTAKAGSPLAGSQLGAAKMAAALFQGYPGVSGETILVK